MALPVFSTSSSRPLVFHTPSAFGKQRNGDAFTSRESRRSLRRVSPRTKPDSKEIEYTWKSSLPQKWESDSVTVFTKKRPNRNTLDFLKETQKYIHEIRKPKILEPETISPVRKSPPRIAKNMKFNSSTTLGSSDNALTYSMKYVGVVDGALSILTSRVPLSKPNRLKRNSSISTPQTRGPDLSLSSCALSFTTTSKNISSTTPLSLRVKTLNPQLSLDVTQLGKRQSYSPKSLSSPRVVEKKSNLVTAHNALIAKYLNRFTKRAPMQALPEARNGVQGWKMIRLELKKVISQSNEPAIATDKRKRSLW